jgi:coenzyme F420-0:L-glutamate ligase/coenzyme F420-1:gamma-L-glutamate ligase
MITIFAPDGIGEVPAGADLAGLAIDSIGRHSDGPLRDGDIVVITSKIVKQGRGSAAACHRTAAGDRR